MGNGGGEDHFGFGGGEAKRGVVGVEDFEVSNGEEALAGLPRGEVLADDFPCLLCVPEVLAQPAGDAGDKVIVGEFVLGDW